MVIFKKNFTAVLLLLLFFTTALTFSSCGKKNEINSTATIGYLTAEEYQSGDYEDKLRESISTGINTKSFAVIDFSLSNLKKISENVTAEFRISFSSTAGTDFEFNVEEIPKADYELTASGVNAVFKLSDGKTKERSFRFIFSVTKVTAGDITIGAYYSLQTPAIEVQPTVNGEKTVNGTVKIDESINAESKLEFTLSSDGSYYVVTGLGGESGDTVRIPDKHKGIPVKEIADNTFLNDKHLIEVMMLEGIERIGASAFSGCTGIETFVIPSSVSSVGEGAFSECPDAVIWCVAGERPTGWSESFASDTATVIYGSSEYFKFNGSTYVFTYYDDKITAEKIIIPEKYLGFSVTSISGDVETAKKSQNSENTEDNKNTVLKILSIPSTVRNIADAAFSDCVALSEIRYNSINCTDIATENLIFSSAGKSSEGITVKIGDMVKRIPDNLFYPSTKDKTLAPNIKTVVFGKKLRNVGKDAFKECTAVTDVHTNDIASFCVIGFYTAEANPLYYSKKLYHNGQLVTELNVPDSVTGIGAYCFVNCDGIVTLNFGSGVRGISMGAFEGCTGLTGVYVGDITQWLNIGLGGTNNLNGTVYNSNPLQYAKNLYVGGELVTELTVPDTVTAINSHAFYGCTSITSIKIGRNVKTVEPYSFAECKGITEISVSAEEIESYAFQNCTRLSSVYVGGYGIKSYAFSGCTGLAKVELGTELNFIGSYSFYKCSNLSSIKFYDTSNWYCGNKFFKEDVKDPSTNAACFKGSNSYWAKDSWNKKK